MKSKPFISIEDDKVYMYMDPQRQTRIDVTMAFILGMKVAEKDLEGVELVK